MFTKKLARSATTGSMSRSLRQKPKILIGKVKYLGNEADLSYKIFASIPGQYENMDTSFDKKLEYEMGKDVGYGADSKSDGQLDSCTNTPKAKCFNSGTVVAPSLGLCDFGSATNDISMGLFSPIFLEPSHYSVAFVKKKICFEPIKFFALDIGLSAVSESSLHDKLKSIKLLFYKIDGFGGVSTSSKLSDIIQTSFTSDSSLALARQLAVSKNLVINANLKKIGMCLDWKIIIKEILVDLPKLAIESVLVKFGKNFSIKMQLIDLWQKVLVEFESSQVADLVAFKWSILLDKDSVHVAKANTDKQIWDLRNSYHALLYTLPMGTTAHNLSDLVQSYARCAVICFNFDNAREAAICSMLVFKRVNLIWAGLSSPKCAACGSLGHVSSGCKSGKKTSGQGFMRKRFLCSDSDKRHLALIYAKKQAPMSCPVSFGGTTWAFVVSGSPKKNLFSTPLIENNLGISSVDGLMPAVMFLALHVSVLECSLENVFDQVADISHKLDRLLAVLSAGYTIPPTLKHNSVLDIAVDVPLFAPPMPSVVTAINLAVLENSVKAILHKLDSFVSGSGTIANKFSGVRVFTSGLDARFLGVGVTLIINENLAKHVSKIFEIPGRLLMVRLGVEKTIDYIFISQSLSNALVNGHVVDVYEFFSTDHSSVQITIGLAEILDPVLRAIHV
ncbi:hypothetical protein G9A89_010564 [Geosiphon pyriformis]|nr:hypothetical protein G9A89_010564 [Geosiphon pyriformis]